MSQIVLKTIGRAFVLAVLGAFVGLVVNIARSDGIQLVASTPYSIYVPCPMMPKEAQGIEVSDLQDMDDYVVVDSRKAVDYDKERILGSRSLPYDPLRPANKSIVDELRALSPNRILVVGDTEIDSGRLLAAELAEAGCHGVRYLKGGFPAWKNAGRKVQSLGATP